ncbi:hypothetical protein NP493_3034g00010 [Ridgeia piscesae]|uniref:ATP-dependent RNA helicase Ski2/MTR4 C-terminal domain-containing protein n=1 Tax=Ridgeia piscesae TaxID=27915 RepID=A0AAD9MYU0_RIDPI|nr:hypothetical protein NP493_3034g00010 [Ridgeia piscesae]
MFYKIHILDVKIPHGIEFRQTIRVLFATETFAMGVNMPARLVIFDSIRKHDGKELRDLLPSEYIQMAGRAVGADLMSLSQFRLTYSMILNLMRVEQIRVEDMMKHSFSEYNTQKDVQRHQVELKEVTEKLAALPMVLDYSGDLGAYYERVRSIRALSRRSSRTVMSHPQTLKALCPGRVVLTDISDHHNVLAVVLQTGRDRTYTVLAVCSQGASTDQASDQCDTSTPRPLLANQLYLPDGACGHCIVTLTASHITSVTTSTVKVNSDKIINDYNKRQQPRFRDDPPGQSASVATQELVRLIESHPDGLPELDPMRDLHIQDMDLVEQFQRINFLRSSLLSAYKCVHDPNFIENEAVGSEEERAPLPALRASLQLLPEFQLRVKVLRELSYVDEVGTVQLKGRVACEISGHELIITELIFHNMLTPLHPTEIAAVLSSVVFQGRRYDKGPKGKSLVKEKFLEIATKIGELQHDCGLDIQVEDYVDEFNFDLMDIVFEWARGVKKAEEASTLIKRDIVFAASLYVQ